ncbi:YciI family protein [Spiractinospora alimapuensis]|uniref:YciI family protein n=1 Tax=Spiractinospora alimapuensis TaxID=2820884 RepID=UPI001F42E789|nr:YciI family protein [Spiractinospora alimapuensis]QVQ54780.1 YciI family protein [Spiractinospora alimapuensis]
MRYLMSIMSDPQSETDPRFQPGPEIFEAMAAYNEEMLAAGVLLSGEGLAPTAEGAKVTFRDGKATVVNGPFTEAKEFIAGYWVLQVESFEEAVRWAKRCPHPPEGDDTPMTLHLRRIAEVEDFGDEMPEHLKDRERELREREHQHG